jgi:radical SAM superfamily enzyme YgiQ (UPF0313 family)
MEPLCFAVLNGLTPSGVETGLQDERIEPINFDEPTDLVAMTVETYTARRAYNLAAEFRRRGVPVVMGGYHPTFLPEEALGAADAVVCGDAEGVWPQVLADARLGHMKGVYEADGFAPIGGSPPDRSIFAGKPYAPITMIQYGRGCRYNCEFCSIRAFYGSHLRQRPIAEVIEEIERTGARTVFFVDDNLFVDEVKTKELFRALIPLGIRWFSQVSIDVARDRELVQLMARSGCFALLIGFESLNEDNLAQMRKKWNLRFGDYATSLAVLRDAGLMIYGTFVFGYDHDRRDSFDEAVEFAIRNRFYLANFNPLTPTPRAPLFDRLQREGRLIWEKWWLDSGFRYGHATFHPRGMTADDLTEGCWRARTEFNRVGSIARRLTDLRTNARSPFRVGLYLLSNRISRREIRRKQGMRLGGAERQVTA